MQAHLYTYFIDKLFLFFSCFEERKRRSRSKWKEIKMTGKLIDSVILTNDIEIMK